jgi:hypothetical protein
MPIAEERRIELAAQVKRVLAGADIPRAAYAKTLCDVLGIAIAQSYRKLNGASDYTLPQIAALEQHFGVELIRVVVERELLTPRKGTKNWTDAVLILDDQSVLCRIVVGSAWQEPPRRPFAAYLERGQWQVCLPSKCPGGAPLFEVEQFACTARTDSPPVEPCAESGQQDN